MVVGNVKCSRSTVPKFVDIPRFTIIYFTGLLEYGSDRGKNEIYHWLLRDWSRTNLYSRVCGHSSLVECPNELAIGYPGNVLLRRIGVQVLQRKMRDTHGTVKARLVLESVKRVLLTR